MSKIPSKSQLALVGQLLREARELRGDSLAQVATRIALTPAQLRAIEAGDLQPFYSPSYYQQATSRYAEALGVPLPEPKSDSGQLSLLTDADSAAPEKDVAQSAAESTARVDATPPALAPWAAPAQAPPVPQVVAPAQGSALAPDTAPPPQSAPLAQAAVPPLQAAPVQTAPSAQAIPRTPKPAAAEPPRQIQRPLPVTQAPATSLISSKTWLIAAALGLITLGVVKVGTNETSKPQVATLALTSPVAPSPTGPEASTMVQAGVSERPATQVSTPATAGAVAAAPPSAPPAPTPTTATATKPDPLKNKVTQKAASSERLDSHLETKASTWVQIVHADGSKTNLRVEPGERVEFNHRSTAAVAFGKPSQIQLTIAGREIDVQPYVQQASPARALVIMSQLKTEP